MTFIYRGFDKEGLKTYGCHNAQNEQQMSSFLTEKGISDYSIMESKTKYTDNNYNLVPPKTLSIFCRQMSVMFFSHITLMEGVQLLAEQTENLQLKIALQEIFVHMEQGYPLAEAMGMYHNIFGSYMLNMVTVGEASGTLDIVFSQLSAYYDKESRVRKKLRAAITYPTVLTLLMGGIIMLLILEILPMFDNILNSMGSEMPAITKNILGASTFISQYIFVIVAVLVLLVGFFLYYRKTPAGQLWFDKMKLKLPGSRYMHVRVITARFSRSLSILLRSGIQLVNALEETKPIIDNKFLESKFTEAFAKVKDGIELSEALKCIGIFPPLFLKMVYIGQTTGHLDEMLDKSASVFDEDVDDAIERMTVMIEPILVIALSIVVGIILVSVMIPMISVMNAIG